MAFDYTNLYPDTSGNGGYTKSWNYTSVVDNVAACAGSGYFNKVATRLGIGDNIVVAQVDAFDRTRTTLLDYGTLFVTAISGGVVTTVNATALFASTSYADAGDAAIAATVAAKANIASPTLTGTPLAPTAAPGTNSTQIATTAYADAIAALKANLASPTFTGTPAAPTAAVDTSTTQLATTAMVLAQAASATPLMAGVAAVGTSTRFARADHVHPTDTTLAPLASPALTGTPTAPTAAAGTNTTQLATTAGIVAERTATATLTNKTLTTPAITTATFGTGVTLFNDTTNSTGSASGSVQVVGGLSVAKDVWVSGRILANQPTMGLGYGTGAGGAVTQITSRTTGVTLNAVTGAVTLVSAAGSATVARFTVTNSTVAATDVILFHQKSGTDRYNAIVTRVAAGVFDIDFYDMTGTTVEQPVFNFAVIKAVAS